VLYVFCWLRVKALDVPDMTPLFYGPRAGDPPPVLWMNVVTGLSVGYIVVWSVWEFLIFLHGARSTYERGVVWALIVVYTITGCNGLMTLVEAVAHRCGLDIAALYQVQTVGKLVAPAATVVVLIGQHWLWPLWRARRDLLMRWLAPELTHLRHDLLNLSAAEAERHLDISHVAYANRAIVEDVGTRCRAVGLSPARCAIARMAASLITFHRDNLLQDPAYGVETSWEALQEEAAAEINQGLAATAWERALRDVYVSHDVYCVMFLVLDSRPFREILLINERPRLAAWHRQLAAIIATVMQAHGQATPSATTFAPPQAPPHMGRWGWTLRAGRRLAAWLGRGRSVHDPAGRRDDHAPTA